MERPAIEKTALAENRLKEFIGKQVWFRTQHSNFNTGVIEEVRGMGHAMIRVIDDPERGCGHFVVHASNIFETKWDLLAANYPKFEAKVDAYREAINDVADLVRFCYSHCTAAENKQDIDYEACSAVRKKAKELLGIEIDPSAAETERELEG